MATGRHSIGVDVDPVAVDVASLKVHRYHPDRLRESACVVRKLIAHHERPEAEYRRRMFVDLSDRTFQDECIGLSHFIPAIPNLDHWFRRYVIIDLALIKKAISRADVPQTHRTFFMVVFASIIRNSSNADPVPVSGLEVTSHMKRLDERGRLVNPFVFFENALSKALLASERFYSATNASTRSRARRGDAMHLGGSLAQQVDCVISSPPYHGAVDYYRRHQLEMFWLNHTQSQDDRLDLLDHYIGRPRVPKRDALLQHGSLETPLAMRWEKRIRRLSDVRADAFRHYMLAMTRVFSGLSRTLSWGAPAVLVVGHSSWNDTEVPTTQLFQELAGDRFSLEELLHYGVKNRYMSYSRHNNADISTEYVLIFRRTRAKPKD